MSKTAILQLPLFITNLDLKKHVLMFDKLIFIKENYEFGMKSTEMIAKKMLPFKKLSPLIMKGHDLNKSNVEFLQEKNLLELISLVKMFKEYDPEKEEMDEKFKSLDKISENFLSEEDLSLINKGNTPLLKGYDKKMNLFIRFLSLIKTHETSSDFIPVINQFNKSNETKSYDVFNFLLRSIPEPKNSVAWEQILDFKNDIDTRKKYYRLINWVNEVSRGEIPLNQIEDKYNELLFEYSERFRIHKMKYNLGTIELITKIASEMISFKFDKAHQTLFSIFKQKVDLLEAETSFDGKQLAYIHKIKQNF